jgi:hypothetical protein
MDVSSPISADSLTSFGSSLLSTSVLCAYLSLLRLIIVPLVRFLLQGNLLKET